MRLSLTVNYQLLFVTYVGVSRSFWTGRLEW